MHTDSACDRTLEVSTLLPSHEGESVGTSDRISSYTLSPRVVCQEGKHQSILRQASQPYGVNGSGLLS